ncbi:MAG TPA: protoporphyrinogen oxidase HemJ [Sphingobacteriaceae bacterium]|nr:protoporphyrinogen oxidase HemJ [Sphingobacteriaceae bacterium]
MAYNYIKAIHLIFMVSWMAGLFYIVRLFIYHTEANDRPDAERLILQRQFQVMESKLWKIITTPAMILTVLAGIAMLYLNPPLLYADWMQIKLLFVMGLMGYHFKCQSIIKQLKQDKFHWSSSRLRIWNEVATIFLVAIVFTVVLKSAVNWIFGLIGLVLFAVIIMSAVKIYKYYRTR